MRKATKSIISFAVILIAGLNCIVPAFAQDPFTAIAVGGLTGASGAGLFGSMAGMSGINIGWGNNAPDEMDAMWNVLNPDHVYFSGEKHEATNIDEDIYDYIQVDIGDWLSAQSDFIVAFAQEHGVSDNDQGSINGQLNFNGVPATDQFGSYLYSAPLGSYSIDTYVSGNTYTYSALGITATITTQGNRTVQYSINTGVQTAGGLKPYANPGVYELRLYFNAGNVYACFKYQADNIWKWDYALAGQSDTSDTVNWTSDTVNTNVFDGWDSAKVKIPSSISQLQSGWTLPDFLSELNRIWYGAGQDNIIIEDGGDTPVPPAPIPDTPLGDVPFDDWVDLWGQSIWEQLTRLEEKQELMVINQETGLDSLDDLQGLGEDLIEDVDDLIGLETDINENLEDMITYEQGISEDVEDLSENVEDIEDEVIVIVDEMGNVIDVLEGIDAKIYAQGQTIGSISTEVGTVADVAEAIQTEVETQTETQEDIKEAVEDLVPYVVPLPDIATDTETMVDILPDISTATQTSTQTLTDTLPDIKDATETITETLPDIINEIQDATTTLTDEIPNIDDICLNIDEAPYKDLETGVDRLPRFMLPFITDLRSALGIWHYVTEWLAQISTTFAFISGCLVGTSIMTPIYAAIAGFMCIKIYRRMCS